MDVDQYVAARYGRLVERAVELGCPEDQAGARVDQVLLEQRRTIRRAEDPDPLVHEALERSIAGAPAQRSRTGPIAILLVAALAVAVGAALTYKQPATPMPSLFALSGTQAQRLLEDQGYDVRLRPARACEPQGLVLGSQPAAGEPVREGDTVTVRTAAPSRELCPADDTARSDAWAFIGFALGGAPPQFAETVHVNVDRSEPATFSHDEALDARRWGGTFDLVARTAHQPAATSTGMPVLRVQTMVPPSAWCGVPRPTAAGRRAALRIQIDANSPRDDRGCPLTIDLYRTGREIDSVVVYTPKGLGPDDFAVVLADGHSQLALRGLAPARRPVVAPSDGFRYDDRFPPRPDDEGKGDGQHHQARP